MPPVNTVSLEKFYELQRQVDKLQDRVDAMDAAVEWINEISEIPGDDEEGGPLDFAQDFLKMLKLIRAAAPAIKEGMADLMNDIAGDDTDKLELGAPNGDDRTMPFSGMDSELEEAPTG